MCIRIIWVTFATMKRKLLLIYFLLCALTSFADSRIFCRVMEFLPSTGLTQRHISNSLSDKLGFIWFATWNGLVRYDGYTFYTFKPSTYSEGTIATNRIFNIKLDSEGNIWCVSLDNRLYHFDTRLCLFTDMSALVKGVSKREVSRIFPLGNGITWVSFKDGACLRLNDRDFRTDWRLFAPGKFLSKGAKLNRVKLNSDGEEWLLSNKMAREYRSGIHIIGDYRFTFQSRGKTILVDKDGNITETRGGRVTAKIKIWNRENTTENAASHNGYTAIGTRQGLAIIKTGSTPALHYMTLKGKEVKDIQFDSKGRIWAFTADNCITLINPVNKEKITLTTPSSPLSIKEKNAQLMFEYTDGTIIVKPYLGTLAAYDEENRKLIPITQMSDEQGNPLPQKEIKRFLIDYQKNLWVFQNDHTTLISFSREWFKHDINPSKTECRALMCDHLHRTWMADRSNVIRIYAGKGEPIYLKGNGTTGSEATFSNAPVYCMTEDNHHRVWIGTKGSGIYVLTPRDKSCTSYNVRHYQKGTNGSSFQSDNVYAISTDMQGKVWIGTYGDGLYRAHEANDGFAFSKVPLDSKYKNIRCVKAYDSQALMVGTTFGLVTLDPRQKIPEPHYNTFRKEEWGLKANDVMQIVVAEGKAYLCMFSEGISEITSRNLLTDDIHFRNTPIPTSSAADQIMNAGTDGKDIWIVSEEALAKFDIKSRRYYIFNQDNFGFNVAFSEAKPIIHGTMMTVGTNDGTMSFDTSTSATISNGRIVFTGIQYQNNMDIRPLNDIQELTIEPDERSFALYMSSLDFRDIGNARYRYMLEGYDKHWNYVDDGQRSVNYSSLPAGDYTLKVQSTGSNGSWHSSERTIKVHVVPLFTETIWFKMALSLIILGIIAGLIYAVIYLRKVRNILQHRYSLLMKMDKLSPKKASSTKNSDEKGKDRIIHETVEYISDNIDNSSIPIDDIAAHLGMSRSSYYTRMKEATGLSPSDFIRQFRIRWALKLLDNKEMTISEVAFSCGYTDPKLFTKHFKAEMGMTPTQYLKN